MRAHLPGSPVADCGRGVALCETCTPKAACKLGVSDLRLTPEGTVLGRFVVPDDARGHVVAHGGWVAWVFDEALGLLPHRDDEWAVTTSLSIRYIRPVPIGAVIEVRSWLDDSDGDLRMLRGDMRLAGTDTVLAAASGRWLVLHDPDRHYDRARDWAREVIAEQATGGAQAVVAP